MLISRLTLVHGSLVRGFSPSREWRSGVCRRGFGPSPRIRAIRGHLLQLIKRRVCAGRDFGLNF